MNNIEILYERIMRGIIAAGLPGLFLCNFKQDDSVSIMHVIAFISFFMASFFILYNSIKLLRTVPGHVPLRPFLIGVFLVAGGAIVDMAATVSCSPDLEREANVLIMMLLNQKYSLGFIYCFALFITLLESAIQLCLWACALAVYPSIIKSIPYQSFFTTFKWIIGAGKMQGFKNLISLKADLYCSLSSFAFIMVILSLTRFYIAFSWFELVPQSRFLLPFIIISIAMLGLTYLTHYKIRKLHYQSFATN